MSNPPDRPQHLIFDGDDTLWENNVLFESVINEFISRLTAENNSPGAIRNILDGIERENSRRHGYGLAVFERSLRECAVAVRAQGAAPTADDLLQEPAESAWIAELCGRIRDSQLEIIPGVPETLATIGGRHNLLLLTKGNAAEQEHKVGVSGLRHYFEHVAIVAEKDERTYRELTARLDLDPARTYMIGNSPRSDIIPALSAGLGAVLVPHPRTWVLEMSSIPPHPRFLTVQKITQLTEIF